MDENRLRSVARMVSYDEWRGINRLDEELLAWNYALTEDALPRWQPLRMDTLLPARWPRSIQSVWRRAGRGAALFDVYECTSRRQAHELLLSLLAHIESPRVARAEEPEAGDVLFTEGGDALRLFARANLVFYLRAAEREPVPIPEAAARLDEDLISKPEPPRDRELPAIESLSVAPAGADAEAERRGAMRLEVRARDPRQRPLWYKCFSPSGEMWLSEGRPVYRHLAPGPARVTVYAVAPDRVASRRDLEWRVS